MVKKVALLTGGGDCPGLNAVIRAAVRKLSRHNVETIGLLEGWRGAITGEHLPLTYGDVAHIINEGGTILGSSRTNPFKNESEDVPRVIETLELLSIDALIAIGGDDTLGVAYKLHRKKITNAVGVPKTIDNDLSATDFTFGFNTAVEIATEATDRIVTTAKSHRRVLIIEIMGRHAGHLAGYVGMAAGADFTLVPERPINLDRVCNVLTERRRAGQLYNIVVVSEGATFEQDEFATQDAEIDAFGHVKLGGISRKLAKLIEEKTGLEARHVVLGHLQRSGPPTAFDRVLATRFGLAAAELVLAGDWGKMVALKGNNIEAVSLRDAVGTIKMLPDEFIETLEAFFEI